MDHFIVLTPLSCDQQPNSMKTNVPTLRMSSDQSQAVSHCKVEAVE